MDDLLPLEPFDESVGAPGRDQNSALSGDEGIGILTKMVMELRAALDI